MYKPSNTNWSGQTRNIYFNLISCNVTYQIMKHLTYLLLTVHFVSNPRYYATQPCSTHNEAVRLLSGRRIVKILVGYSRWTHRTNVWQICLFLNYPHFSFFFNVFKLLCSSTRRHKPKEVFFNRFEVALFIFKNFIDFIARGLDDQNKILCQEVKCWLFARNASSAKF